MMKALLTSVILLSVGAAAQSNDSLERSQKTLKKNLLDHAPEVSSVSFKDCQLTVKTSVYFSSTAFSGGSSFVGGGFPNDESSNYLSAGPDKYFGSSMPSTKLEFNLSDLNAASFKVAGSLSKGRSVMTLTTENTKDLIVFRRMGKQFRTGAMVTFIVKTKAADKVVEAFRQAIEQCKS